MSTSGDIMSTSGGYHDACGGGGRKLIKVFQFLLKTPMY